MSSPIAGIRRTLFANRASPFATTRGEEERVTMKFLAAALVVCIAAGGAFGIAPPVDGGVPPEIVPFNPPRLPPDGGIPQTPPVNTPEPASLTIMGISLAAAGAYSCLRRRQLH
jgi:hypothetical protein